MLEKTKLAPFNMENLPLVVDVVEPLWCPPIGDAAFKRFNVEYIVRNNIAENDYRFELVDTDDNLLSAAFFARKGDISQAEQWFSMKSSSFSDDLLAASDMSRTYLKMMDERTLSLMNDDDIKLSLFVSRERGAGTAILEAVCSRLRAEGWKNLFLWTDCDCNWQWYEKKGYTLVHQDTYAPFSGPDTPYKTFIFKKPI